MSYVLIILTIILIWTMLLRPRRRAKQAIPSIIQVFRDHNAVGLRNAKTIDELGFEFKTPRMFRVPDYRLTALSSLIKATVIQLTEEGKLYLYKENPAAAKRKRKPKTRRER